MKKFRSGLARLLRQPLTPYILIAAVLLGLGLAGMTIALVGKTAPIIYADLPYFSGELDEGPDEEGDQPTVVREAVVRPAPVPRLESPLPGSPPVSADPALLEETGAGVLPQIGPQGETSFQRYSREQSSDIGLPTISIVLTNLGMMYDISEKATILPVDVSLAYSPYASDAAGWSMHGRSHGHEILLEMPTAAVQSNIDRGPLALSPRMDRAQLLDTSTRLLAASNGYIGLVGDAGEFASEPALFSPILEQLRRRGVGFVELNGQHFASMARDLDLPYLSITEVLDSVLDPDEIQRKLASLEERALVNGSASAYLRPYPLSLDALWRWSQDLEQRGVVLSPVSHSIRLQSNAG